MTYSLSDVSMRRLAGVHPDLVDVVKKAITITDQDFRVIEGLRTIERQRYLVAKGASKTLQSRHITGHAVDLAPVVDGQVSWDWKCFHPIAAAMKQAAEELKIPVRWGGAWAELSTLSPGKGGLFKLHDKFPDGPHFELLKSRYS